MLKLEIISPEGTLFSDKVESVTLPGTAGQFTVLDKHAPLISSLEPGVLSYKLKDITEEIHIDGGFAEVRNDIVSVCIDGGIKKEE